jgi:hypothetical protein
MSDHHGTMDLWYTWHSVEAHNIKFWHIPVDEYESKVDAIATERGCTNRELTDVSLAKEGFGEVSYS